LILEVDEGYCTPLSQAAHDGAHYSDTIPTDTTMRTALSVLFKFIVLVFTTHACPLRRHSTPESMEHTSTISRRRPSESKAVTYMDTRPIRGFYDSDSKLDEAVLEPRDLLRGNTSPMCRYRAIVFQIGSAHSTEGAISESRDCRLKLYISERRV
jgi:hypothetical protein